MLINGEKLSIYESMLRQQGKYKDTMFFNRGREPFHVGEWRDSTFELEIGRVRILGDEDSLNHAVFLQRRGGREGAIGHVTLDSSMPLRFLKEKDPVYTAVCREVGLTESSRLKDLKFFFIYDAVPEDEMPKLERHGIGSGVLKQIIEWEKADRTDGMTVFSYKPKMQKRLKKEGFQRSAYDSSLFVKNLRDGHVPQQAT